MNMSKVYPDEFSVAIPFLVVDISVGIRWHQACGSVLASPTIFSCDARGSMSDCSVTVLSCVRVELGYLLVA